MKNLLANYSGSPANGGAPIHSPIIEWMDEAAVALILESAYGFDNFNDGGLFFC